MHGTSRYKQIEPGKNISHLTRVNSSSNSSKTIVPKKIIEGLNLRYDDDYLEWRIEARGGRKVATVRKFRRRLNQISSDDTDAGCNTELPMLIIGSRLLATRKPWNGQRVLRNLDIRISVLRIVKLSLQRITPMLVMQLYCSDVMRLQC